MGATVESARRVRTADGGQITADLATAERPWAGAVVCHPHPAYGGDRHNAVVDRVFHALAAAGLTAARFDFRAADADSARLDVLAALDLVAEPLAGAGPLWLVGYSFGADVALAVGDERVAGWAAVAPPLRFGPQAVPAGGDGRPALVLAAAHDQFTPLDRLRAATAAWPDATVVEIPMADHFLAGAAGRVADEVLAWLRARSAG
ncbi:MAG TPA: hypothetical protein VIL48_02830 [Acidimicrobiales bacterium]